MLPEWALELPWPIIKDNADEYNLDPYLIASIIKVESNNDPSTSRFEPGWKYHWECHQFARNNRISVETESVHQATSWGLMQVMGTVARELGYSEQLPALIDPYLGIEYGAKKLAQLWDRDDVKTKEDLISSYNAGSPRRTKGGFYVNERYVDKVSKLLRELNRD